MTISIEYDIKEILTKLDNRLEKIETKIDKLEEKIQSVKEDVSELKTEIKVLDGKVDAITKRLESQEFLNRGVIIGLIVALLGGLAKLFGFNGFN